MIWMAAVIALVLGEDAVKKLTSVQHALYAAGVFEAGICALLVVGCIVAYCVRGDD